MTTVRSDGLKLKDPDDDVSFQALVADVRKLSKMAMSSYRFMRGSMADSGFIAGNGDRPLGNDDTRRPASGNGLAPYQASDLFNSMSDEITNTRTSLSTAVRSVASTELEHNTAMTYSSPANTGMDTLGLLLDSYPVTVDGTYLINESFSYKANTTAATPNQHFAFLYLAVNISGTPFLVNASLASLDWRQNGFGWGGYGVPYDMQASHGRRVILTVPAGQTIELYGAAHTGDPYPFTYLTTQSTWRWSVIKIA